MSYFVSRLICRVFGHDWSNDIGTAVCERRACYGHLDAVRHG